LGFFEEVGLYWDRNLIDRDLVDEILGDEIIDYFEDDTIMKYVGSVRGRKETPLTGNTSKDSPTRFIRLRDKRRK
jgi:hypothetical protein